MPIQWLDSAAQPKRKITWEDEAQPLELGVTPQAHASLPQEDIHAQSVVPTLISRERTPAQKAAAEVAASMSAVQQHTAQFGRGFAELGQAIKQLNVNTTAALTPAADDSALKAGAKLAAARMLNVSPSDDQAKAQAEADAYNAQVADEAKIYNAGLGKLPGGTVAPMAAQMVATLPTAPLVGGAPTAGVVGSALRSAGTGAAAAALTQPVTEGDDYWTSKAKQAGLGAAVGGATDVGLRTLGRVAEEAASPGRATRLFDQVTKARSPEAQKIAKEGAELEQRMQLGLTPGMQSGNKALIGAENTARQSVFTANAVGESDRKIADRYAARANELVDSLGGATDSATAGSQIAGTTKRAMQALQSARRAQAKEDFGVVDAMTKGSASIDPNASNAVLRDVLSTYEGAGTDAGDAFARWAKKQLSNVDPTVAAAAKKLGNQKLATANAASAPAQGNLAKLLQLRSHMSEVASGQSGISGKPVDRMIASRMLEAIDQDIEGAAQNIGGDLGAALRKANANYRDYSQKIDGVKNGPLGKLLGDDLVDHAGNGFSSVAPEQLFDRFSKLEPSHMRVAVKLLGDTNPQALQAARAAYVQRAIDNAAPTAGGGMHQAPVRPAAFLNSLAKGQKDKERLAALFDDKAKAQIDDLLKAGQRIGDKTGYNASGTDVRAETRQLLGVLKDWTVKGVASTAGQAMGLRQVAKAMADPGAREALLTLRRLPPQAAEARKAIAYLNAFYATQPERPEDGAE